MILIFFIGIFFTNKTVAQEFKKKKQTDIIRLGLNFGHASQAVFPYNNPNYLYKTNYFKIQINYLLTQKKRFKIELNLEPSLYFSEHQLLNEYYIGSKGNPDYLEQRETFTKKRLFNEYAINVGIITRYNIMNNLSTYLIGSIGPMNSGVDTERLKKGFAFSDIVGFGFAYRRKIILFDIRLTLRHNSNANLSMPNNGHNSAGVESGISFQL
jgi:hypothetical protein